MAQIRRIRRYDRYMLAPVASLSDFFVALFRSLKDGTESRLDGVDLCRLKVPRRRERSDVTEASLGKALPVWGRFHKLGRDRRGTLLLWYFYFAGLAHLEAGLELGQCDACIIKRRQEDNRNRGVRKSQRGVSLYLGTCLI